MNLDLDDLAERLADAAERVATVPPERQAQLELLVRRLERFLDGSSPLGQPTDRTREAR